MKYVSDRILVLEEKGIREIRSINDYLEMMNNQNGFSDKETKNETNTLAYEKQKVVKNKIQKIERTIEEINNEYLKMESEHKNLEKEMLQPHNAKDYNKLSKLSEQNAEIEEKMFKLLENLETLENEKEVILRGRKDA